MWVRMWVGSCVPGQVKLLRLHVYILYRAWPDAFLMCIHSQSALMRHTWCSAGLCVIPHISMSLCCLPPLNWSALLPFCCRYSFWFLMAGFMITYTVSECYGWLLCCCQSVASTVVCKTMTTQTEVGVCHCTFRRSGIKSHAVAAAAGRASLSICLSW